MAAPGVSGPKMHILVRHGPAPGDTEDEDGEIHTKFTGFFMIDLAADDIAAMFGTDGSDGTNPGAFVDLVRKFWRKVVKPESENGFGGGHLLVGACTGFEYITSGPAACGFQLGTTTGGMPFAPKNYVPLYAVARTRKPAGHVDPPGEEPAPPHIDLAIDYRDNDGPGDESIRPTVFVARPDPKPSS